MEAAALDELTIAVIDGQVIRAADAMESYRRDMCTLVDPGMPAAVVMAGSTTDVSRTLEWAHRHAVPVVPRAAGTGLAGGATALDNCIVLSLTELTHIEIDADDRLATVGPGVINADLSRAAAPFGLYYAPDPGSYDISTIGGNIATNAGGLRCVKYGVTRQAVLGLEVVLADGTVLHTGGRTVKDVAGYDLTGLFIGSEGTLGVITSATVRLTPASTHPPATVVAQFATIDQATNAITAVSRSPVTPSMLELLDKATTNAIENYRSHGLNRDAEILLLCQLDGAGAANDSALVERLFNEAGAVETVRSADPDEGDMLWSARRLAHVAVEALGANIVEDVGVSPSRLGDLLRAIDVIATTHNVRIATVGHAGDGNMHPCIVFDPNDRDEHNRAYAAAEAVCREAVSLGGTITGEHGVGEFKRRWLTYQLGPQEMRANRAIKFALDPRGILNPGRGL
ncbi:MAG: FAD-linked oxidase C-terminal domain-containing protein [Mycobacterium sp.]